MKRLAIIIGLALGAGACTDVSEEDQLENTIKAELSKDGSNVTQVEMTRKDDNNFTGFVLLESDGRKGRLNCNANRENGSETSFHFKCSPAIDEEALRQMEDVMRRELASKGTVKEVKMTRAGDDNHMRGNAVIEIEDGTNVPLACTAVREQKNIGSFSWNCEEQDAAAAPAEEAEAAAPAEEGEPAATE